jgi:hypothetical protein
MAPVRIIGAGGGAPGVVFCDLGPEWAMPGWTKVAISLILTTILRVLAGLSKRPHRTIWPSHPPRS